MYLSTVGNYRTPLWIFQMVEPNSSALLMLSIRPPLDALVWGLKIALILSYNFQKISSRDASHTKYKHIKTKMC